MILFRCLLLAVLMIAMPAQAEAPWREADVLRIESGRIERLLYRAADPARDDDIARRLSRMQAAWLPLAAAYGEARAPAEAALAEFAAAAQAGEGPGAAWSRQILWAALMQVAMSRTLDALAEGDALEAGSWLHIRDYARASGDTAAVLALEELRTGRLSAQAARQTVESELLTIAAAELKLALDNAAASAKAGQATRLAGSLGRAEGLRRLLDANLQQRLGAEEVAALASDLRTALQQASAATEAIAAAQARLMRYAPVSLAPEERARRALLLRRFTALIWEEYRDGVRDGRVSQPMEYYEAVLFRNRAAMIFGGLAPGMADPETAHRLGNTLAALGTVTADKGDAAEVRRLVDEALALIDSEFSEAAAASGYAVAVDMLPAVLDELVLVAKAGDWAEAELKRLEAYSWFDPDIEQRLVPRAPALSLRLEARFWQGRAATPGLGTLIAAQGPVEALEVEVDAIKMELASARERIEAPLSTAGAVFQSAMIIFREGLEAVLILAALFGAMRAEGVETSRFRRPASAGVILAILGSFVLWAAARWLLSISTLQREAIEGGTALLAAVVLIWLTQSLFRRSNRGHTAALRARIAMGVSPAAVLALAFLVVFREGFETVLFYEALLVDAAGGAVLAGFVAGGVAALAAGWAVLKAGRRLPLGWFFKVTGAMLAVLSVMLVGAGIRGLQTAALVPATPVAWFPERDWLQLWLGLYPVAESLAVQAVVVLILIAMALRGRRVQ